MVNHSHYKTIKRIIFAAAVVLHTWAMCPALVFQKNCRRREVTTFPFTEALRAAIGSSSVFMRVGGSKWIKIAPRARCFPRRWRTSRYGSFSDILFFFFLFFPLHRAAAYQPPFMPGQFMPRIDKENETAADVSSGRVDAEQAPPYICPVWLLSSQLC